MKEHSQNYLLIGIVILVLFVAGVLAFMMSGDAPVLAPVIETLQEDPVDPTWATYTDPASSISFRYPAELPTAYIHATAWPPTVTLNDAPYACNAQGSGPGEAREIHIDGASYCVTESSEGAAGSIYSEYLYRTEHDGKLLALSFTLRSTQCGNYDEAQMQACTIERESFDVHALIGQIARTVEFL